MDKFREIAYLRDRFSTYDTPVISLVQVRTLGIK